MAMLGNELRVDTQARYAAVHGRLGYSRGKGGGNIVVHCLWNNLAFSKLLFSDQRSQAFRCCQLHGAVDNTGTHIQCAPEESWERQGVAPLVGIVGAARFHYALAF